MSESRAYAGLAVCAALWGLVFVANHELLAVLDAEQIVTARYLLVALAFAALLAVRPAWRVRPSRRDWAMLALCGLLAVPLSQLPVVEGQRFLAPPLAAMLIASGPVSGALFAAAFLRERITARHVLGLGVALSGVALIVLVGAGSGASGESSVLGAFITIVSPTAWAAYTVVSKPLAARYAPVAAVGLTCVVGGVFLLPLLPHTLPGLDGLSAADWWWLAFLVTAGTVAPFLLWFSSLRALPVNAATPFMYLVPVFATGWTVAVLGQLPESVTLLGGALVVTGVALTQVAQRRAAIAESAA